MEPIPQRRSSCNTHTVYCMFSFSSLVLFTTRVDCLFSSDVGSMGVIAYINESLCKFELSSYFDDWFVNSVFPSYNEWKSIINQRIHEYENAK